MAPQARQMAADGHGRSWTAPLHKVEGRVSARLQPGVGVNIALCNGRVKVSESVRTGLYMFFEVGKQVVNPDFNEGGSTRGHLDQT